MLLAYTSSLFFSLIRHLIYFGSTIFHTYVSVDQVHKGVLAMTIERAKDVNNALILDQFSKYIEADFKKMYSLLKKPAPTNYLFAHLEELDTSDSDVYIFQYRNPQKDSQFSAIQLTDLLSKDILQVYENADIVPTSSLYSDHTDHYALELFRQSSALLDGYFSSILSSVPPADKPTIQKAKEVNTSLSHPLFSGDYTEREWTERLYNGMKLHTPELNPKLTLDAARGAGFQNNVLRVWSGVKNVKATCVPLHGSPDITYDNKIVNVADGTDGSNVSDSSVSPMEEVTVAKSLIVSSFNYCPDKLGELSVALLTKAYCKFLRRLKSTAIDQGELIVHGMYLNRPECEVIQCELHMTPTLVTGSRRKNSSKTRLNTVLQYISSVGDLCKALHYHCHD